jgi:hypothetical protein
MFEQRFRPQFCEQKSMRQKQNVSFRTYRRQEQTLTDLQIRQRESNGRSSASNGGAAILKSPSLWETILGSGRVIV